MDEKPSNSKPDKRGISAILKELSSKQICLIVIVGLVLIAAILMLAVQKGQKVNLWGIGTEPPAQDKNSILASDLVNLSPKYFDSKYDKARIMNIIRQLVDKAENLENMETILSYRIAMVEVMIPKFGSSINTSVKDNKNKNRVEAYKKIQIILKDIGFYEGEIDGDQGSTNKAVVEFQRKYNEQAKRDIIPPEEFGYFGYYTCWAVGKWSRR